MELKAKGPSRRTFSALSKKLKKPSEQVGRLPLLPAELFLPGPAGRAAAEADANLCVLLCFIFFPDCSEILPAHEAISGTGESGHVIILRSWLNGSCLCYDTDAERACCSS